MRKWKVNLYTFNTITSQKGGSGIVGYILETIKNRETLTIQQFYRIQAKSHEAELIAVTEAVQRIVMDCELNIYTGDYYVVQTIENGSIERWEKNGWKTAKGEPVKYADLWQKMAYLPVATDISVIYTKNHHYTKWMNHFVENHGKGIKEYAQNDEEDGDR
jgi:ribonuclease HI